MNGSFFSVCVCLSLFYFCCRVSDPAKIPDRRRAGKLANRAEAGDITEQSCTEISCAGHGNGELQRGHPQISRPRDKDRRPASKKGKGRGPSLTKHMHMEVAKKSTMFPFPPLALGTEPVRNCDEPFSVVISLPSRWVLADAHRRSSKQQMHRRAS